MYIESKKNIDADLLSRFQIDKFKELCPDADSETMQCPSPEKTIMELQEAITVS